MSGPTCRVFAGAVIQQAPKGGFYIQMCYHPVEVLTEETDAESIYVESFAQLHHQVLMEAEMHITKSLLTYRNDVVLSSDDLREEC